MSSASGGNSSLTRVVPLGYSAGDCGYCKNEDTGASYYMTSSYLLPEHYQKLMDRGWRRLPAAEYKPSRDQRQALNRWNTYVLGEDYVKRLAQKYPLTKEQKKAAINTFNLLDSIHKSESFRVKLDIACDHLFKVTLEPDNFTEAKYRLYEHYQQVVHKESPTEISRSGFKRFLCSSPIVRNYGSSSKQLGSYHQCYWLDDRLIAFAVLDLLPHAVSGVYFVYHQDFERFSFGKLSAMMEAALAGEGGYEYYYMGYYIPNCEKMRYKGLYQPQYVLDLLTHTWDILGDEMRGLMAKLKFVSMSEDRRIRSTPGAVRRTYRESTPAAAVSSEDPLLVLGMPGIMSLAEVRKEVDLKQVKAILHTTHEVVNLLEHFVWEDGTETDPSSLLGMVAELAACLGPDVIKDIAYDLG